MKNNKWFYFQRGFILGLPITVGFLVYHLLGVDTFSMKLITQIAIKSLATGFMTGLVLGVLNLFFKK